MWSLKNDINTNINRNAYFSSYMPIYDFAPHILENRALKNYDLTQLMY